VNAAGEPEHHVPDEGETTQQDAAWSLANPRTMSIDSQSGSTQIA